MTVQTTFHICDAETPAELLPRLPYRYMLESRFLNGDLLAFSRNVPYLVDAQDEGATLDSTKGKRALEPYLLDALLGDSSLHPLIQTIYTAFNYHYPLTLSPDTIWLVLCQGFASHVKENAEALREHFVSHSDKETLKIRRDEFVLGSPYNDWEGVFSELVELLHTHIGDTSALLTPQFSMTTPTAQAAFNITLLDAMQPYFEYSMVTLCGIPTITLEGTPADWEMVLQRFAEFKRFDLAWWVDALMPTLQEFVNASNGRVNKSVWQDLCKIDNKSGGPYFNGWMLKFFPYIKVVRYDKEAQETVESLTQNPYLLPNPPEKWGDGLGANQIPNTNATVPLAWEYLGQRLDLLVMAGLVGFSQDQATKSLRPEIGWAVGEKSKMMGSRPQNTDEWAQLLQSKLAKRERYIAEVESWGSN